jgi:hypothetical protein
MTNAEAIKILLNEWKCIDRNDGVHCDRKCESCDLVMDSAVLKDAYNLAIKALEAQAHIVNCPDCKYAMRNQGELWICGHPNNNAWRITDDFYCGRGMI